MKIRSPHLWIALISTGVVLSLALVDVGRTSPGPLTTVHERESELTGRRGCVRCHGSWGVSMTEACLDCHDGISLQIELGDGLHGSLRKEEAKLCALCHSEHHGADFAIVNSLSFVTAGAPSLEEFDHRLIGFPMDGQHVELDCNECHEHAHDEVLPKEAVRFLGLDMDCVTCHEDVHEGTMVVACAQCHGQEAFDQLGSLGHERFVPLIGGHGDMDCLECHGKGSFHSLDALGTASSLLSPRECVDCHESPHQSEFVAGVAQLVSSTAEASCSACHEGEHLSFDDEAMEVTPEMHACSGFALDAPHEEVACADCHLESWRRFRARYPGREAEDCGACHDDPHEGQFGDGAFAALHCTACHASHEFEPHTFTVQKHERADFPLTGSHLDVDCNVCHETPAEERPRVFNGTPSDCDGCHEDAHDGFFDSRSVHYAPIEFGDCARCHVTTTFAEIPADGFDHERWTGLPVIGAHAQAECESCHPPSEEPDQFGRTFGRVADHFGAFEGCVTCHVDLHEGIFDTLRLPQHVEGRTGCARCHTHASFRAFTDAFDHRRWVGFPLLDAHAEIGCSACHPPLSRPTEIGRTWKRAAGQQCSDCHDSPHAGQFDVNGATDCRRCHRSAVGFSKLAFNHERHSRFRPGEAHADVACAACHDSVFRDDVEIVRYVPLPTECVDCHGDHVEPLRKRKGGRR